MKNKNIKSLDNSLMAAGNLLNYFKLYLDNNNLLQLEEIDSTEKNVAHSCSRKFKKRQNNSLEELTKKFINSILESQNNIIDLNKITKKMKVKKRRIYDITNVLEGNLNLI